MTVPQEHDYMLTIGGLLLSVGVVVLANLQVPALPFIIAVIGIPLAFLPIFLRKRRQRRIVHQIVMESDDESNDLLLDQLEIVFHITLIQMANYDETGEGLTSSELYHVEGCFDFQFQRERF
ncbi:hypothetical protein ACNAN0_11850 [Agrilactobacillus fermenti]|uniref:hypothetical protein n=1 Tax=Agrilactobacillus fermenti TaxID=2586909 RepID=UPI001E3D0D3A|nr:hypothetical protein [Agrilactobacillus fermenti]MCD2255742.1 hypothetical protein [Agrilactobacillus fermenti]